MVIAVKKIYKRKTTAEIARELKVGKNPWVKGSQAWKKYERKHRK